MKARVMIAAGERGVALDLSRGLMEAGYDVAAIATTGPQALDSCLEHRPDLVLIDVESPALDGLALTTRIMAACPACVIAISSRPDLASAAERAGAMGHVVVTAAGAESAAALDTAWKRCEGGLRPTPSDAELPQPPDGAACGPIGR
jgi:AmiR/NasT family two-component response regulator